MADIAKRKSNRKNYDGHKFGRWTVISEALPKGRRKTVLAVCECGVQRVTRLDGLRSGASRSCGCLQKESSRNRRLETPIGSKYNLLTILGDAPDVKYGRFVKVRCDCGELAVKRLHAVRAGLVKSCGCLSAVVTGNRARTHGLSKTPEYNVWFSMVDRCTNPSSHAYGNYGGRGIVVCERWLDFTKFHEDMSPRPEGKSIDRIDNNKGYSPKNCRWASAKQQQSNTRMTRFVRLDGSVVTFAEAARRIGVWPSTISDRVAAGRLQEVFKP